LTDIAGKPKETKTGKRIDAVDARSSILTRIGKALIDVRLTESTRITCRKGRR
jgi:hypothetical protein